MSLMEKNTPYVKQFDKNGTLLNPIKTKLLHDLPNRRQRRESLQKHRFFGNGKNIPLTVLNTGKYLRMIQTIVVRDKKTKEFVQTKRIEHYVPC